MKPEITVLMPVYNGERFLRDAITSILNQSFKKFEFLIVDDGSTDSSVSIVKEYRDDRICLIINEKNMGIPASLNKGIRLAKGKYIARQDADDISDKKRLELQIRRCESNPQLGLLGTRYTHMDSKGQLFDQVNVITDHETLRETLKTKNCFAGGSVMFPKDKILELGAYRNKFFVAQDYDLWTRISEKYRVENLKENLYFLRRGTSTVSTINLRKPMLLHILITELAKERRTSGEDSLDEINFNNENDVYDLLISRFKVPESKIHDFFSYYYTDFYYQSLNSNNLPLALRYWGLGFYYEPRKWKIKKLFKRLFDKYFTKK